MPSPRLPRAGPQRGDSAAVPMVRRHRRRSQGRLLIANITTRERSFMVAAGWGVRYSLEAQNAKGLAATESAVQIVDHADMCEPYKGKFSS
jgi:hypothetical protein